MLSYPQQSLFSNVKWGALVLVAIFLGLAFALTEAGLDYSEGANFSITTSPWIGTLGWYCGSLLATSILLGFSKRKLDPWLLPLIGLLGGVSLTLMYRLPTPYWDAASQSFAYATRNMWYVKRQLSTFVLGQIVLLIVVFTPGLLNWLRTHRRVSIGAGMLLLIATALFGTPAAPGGPRVTLDLGIFTFQPTELIKLAFVVYLASYLDYVRWDFNRFTRRYFNLPLPVVNYIFPMLIVLGAVIIILGIMSDLGAALILLGIFPVMIYLGVKRHIFWSLLAIATVTLMLAWGGLVQTKNCTAEHFNMLTNEATTTFSVPLPGTLGRRVEQAVNRVKARVENWKDPWQACTTDNGCASYQTLEGLYAVAAGGIWGAGPGLGHPENIPFNFSDLIFAVIAEEWGLLGAGAIIIVYWLIIYRGIIIARKHAEPFNIMLSMGIVTIFALQTIIIIGGTLNLLPLTGITVPFISFGRSSVLANFIMVGILFQLSARPAAISATQETQGKLKQLTHIFGIGFAALALALVYWTLWMSPKLHPAFPANNDLSGNPVAWQRQSIWLKRVTRGTIFAADGTPLVTGTNSNRTVTDLSLIHALGETDKRGIGVNGLEKTYNETLLGQGRYDLQTLLARQLDGTWRGNDLTVTIEPDWQQTANAALGGYDGSVVILDAKTGGVLAMVSHPLYDPTKQDALQNDPAAPMLNRAVSGLYPPGSTFKTVVAALALENNLAKPKTGFDFTGDEWYWVGNQLCHHEIMGGANIVSCNTYLQQMTLTEGYGWSDNVLFANLAIDLGTDALWNGAHNFGFGQNIPFDIPVQPSQLADTVAALQDPAHLAMTGFGQSEVVATPLQMALVAAAIANDGKVPQPYLVSKITKPDGSALRTIRPSVWLQAVGRRTARDMKAMMIHGVEDGWASSAAVTNLTVGGKTGTAEWSGSANGSALAHSWFIGFAEMPDGRTVAIAVIAEAAGEGSTVAAPIAGYIFRQMAFNP